MSLRKRSHLDPQARVSQDLDALASCERCPRLAAWRREISLRKRAAYAEMPYWGAPVPPFGEDSARILLLGLAPGAHGANRTGRMFTGDSSAEFLVSALHRCGLSSKSKSTARDDGLRLLHTRMTCAVRCVPPENRPTRDEIHNCEDWLIRELALLRSLKVIVALGSLAWDAALRVTQASDRQGTSGDPTSKPQAATTPPPTSEAATRGPRPRKPRFAHGASAPRRCDHGSIWLLGSYHPSQQNTFTGLLTPPMLDAVLHDAARHAGLRADGPSEARGHLRPPAKSRAR